MNQDELFLSPEPTPTAFDAFWAAWPRHHRKQAKVKCRAKWKRDKLDSKIEHIMAVLKVEKFRWAIESNKYVPAPLVWLNGQRWDCEIEDVTPKRDKKCSPLAKQIADSGDVRYGVDTARARELMNNDSPVERTRKTRQMRTETGNPRLTTWQCYVLLAERERKAAESDTRIQGAGGNTEGEK